MTRNNKLISVVICTFNEEKNLSHVLPKIPEWVDEIILVDGHSNDKTVDVAKKLSPKIRILYQLGKGKGDALRYGIKNAKGDMVVSLDADGSMRPEEILYFIEPLFKGYDFVKGTRFKEGGGTLDMQKHRIFANRFFAKLSNLLHRTNYTDVTYGYNAFRKQCLEKIKLRGNGFEIETEMAIKAKKAGLKIIEVSSYEDLRLDGEAKLRSLRDGWRILRTILKECFCK